MGHAAMRVLYVISKVNRTVVVLLWRERVGAVTIVTDGARVRVQIGDDQFSGVVGIHLDSVGQKLRLGQ